MTSESLTFVKYVCSFRQAALRVPRYETVYGIRESGPAILDVPASSVSFLGTSNPVSMVHSHQKYF